MVNKIEERAQIGIFGGSGFYKFLDDIEEIKVETPYGAPSDKIMLGSIGKKKAEAGYKETVLSGVLFRHQNHRQRFLFCLRSHDRFGGGFLRRFRV